jgi:hypothetical protein
MAFAITGTTGAGQVSVAAGSQNVTGSGAGFTSALIGRVFYVGAQWGIVQTVTDTATLRLDRPFASAVTLQPWGNAILTDYRITQSGTDTSLNGLSTLPNVTVSTVGSGTGSKRVYNIAGLQLNVTGTLTHDGDLELLMGSAVANPGFNLNNPTLTKVMVTVSAGGIYNFGTTSTVNGIVRYSTGLGISNSGVGADPFSTAWLEVKNGGSFIWRGGMIEKSSCEYLRYNATFTVFRGVLYNKGTADYQLRSEAADAIAATTINISGLTLDGITNSCRLYTLFGINTLSVTPNFSNYQFNASGSLAQNGALTLTDWRNANNASAFDVFFNSNAATNSYQTFVDGFERQLQCSQQVIGSSSDVITCRRNFTFTAQTASKTAIQGAAVYLREIDNGNRGIVNTINFTPTVTTVGTTNSSGQYSVRLVVENIWAAFGTSTIRRDFRYNTDATLNVSIWAYNYQYWSVTEGYIGTGTRAPTYALIADTYVTLSESAAVSKLASSFTVSGTTVTVTANSTLDDLYDALKAYKTRSVAAQLETPTISSQIVSASGTDLTGYTGWTLVVNTGVTLSSGTKLKRVIFDTVTKNGSITSLYIDGGNPSARLTLNGVNGGNVVVFDNTGAVVDYADSVSANYVMNIASGKTGTWTWAVEKYGFKRQSGTFTPGSGGDFSAIIAYVQDINLTVTNEATVAAYTSLENPTKVFDYVSYWRSSSNGIEFDLVSKAATLVDFGASSVTFTPFISAPAGAVGALVPVETPEGVVFMPQGTILGGPLYYEDGPDLFTISSGFNLAPASLVGFTTTGKVTIQELVNFTATMSGGTLNLPIPDTYAFGVVGSILELNQSSASTYNLRGCTISGTISLKNMSAFPMTVYLPNGTSYSTAGNTGGTITVDDSVPTTITAPNLVSGTRVRLYNVTDSTELYNGVIGSGGLTFNINWTANKTIRLTATYQSGTSAKLPLSATGIFTSNGLQFLDTQSDDTVYNELAINGSTVTGFSADYTNTDINITAGTNFSGADLYAWWVYSTTTADGIRYFVGGITASDVANFRINVDVVSLYIDNTTSTSIYQTDNRRIYRSDEAYPVRTPTSGGGGVDIAWRDQILLAQSDDITAIKNNTDLIPALL